MKATSAQFAQDLAAASCPSKGYLLFGPNNYLVKKLRDQLLATVVGNKQDRALQVTYLEGKELAKDEQLLWDVSMSSSFFGSSPVVEILNPSKELAPLLKKWLSSKHTVGKVIITAGGLKPSDPLRLLFSNAKQTTAVACYDETKSKLVAGITAKLRKAGVKFNQETTSALHQYLPNQVQGADFYTGKLVYYAAEKKVLTAADVVKCLAESKPLVRLQQIADSCAAGDIPALLSLIHDKKNLNEPAMGFVRWVARHFKILLQLRSQAASLAELSSLLRSFRPPLHFSQYPSLTNHWRRWSLAQLDVALAILLETEIAIKNNHPFGGETITAQLVKVARLPDITKH